MIQYLLLTIIFSSVIGLASGSYEEADFSGPSLYAQYQKRITDFQGISQSIHISALCHELEDKDYISLKRLDLSKNFIGDSGAKELSKFFARGKLPELKVLDLSFNHITDKGITYFNSLLKRKNFDYLIIYGNNGAATSEGITNLIETLSTTLEMSDINQCLAKVIWIPESWVKGAEARGDLPPSYAASHSHYYHNYKCLE